ncbi:DUF559 domain-containing protein [Cellulomonas sp. APG4]|uniref:DUF559 domain-containing protein n=1 Tax=Cellulomonas sp. APG4 TaxID=1538656 RepID=UPI00137AB12B|nr:DUF559 domain-containing protein [Cellulomonas sp. APG4]NCT91114.1 DUF559 domain-containing protein [Cellulomonas sp. APG4]
MMRPSSALIVRAREAAARGVSEGAWRGPGMVAVRRGVRVDSLTDPLNPDVRIAAVAGDLPEHAVVGGWGAARLLEARDATDDLEVFDGRRRWDDGQLVRQDFAHGQARVLVVAARESRLTLRPDVRVLRSEARAHERVEVDGIRITSPVRTALDLARLLPLTTAVIGLDRLIHVGAVTPVEVADALDAWPRARGAFAARRALSMVDGAAESPQESLLRLAWVQAGLPRPRANAVVLDGVGRFVARVDLFDEQAGVVGEYDGAYHASAERRAQDAERQEWLEDLGLTVVRATAVDLRDGAAVARWQGRLRAGYRRARSRRPEERRWTTPRT